MFTKKIKHASHIKLELLSIETDVKGRGRNTIRVGGIDTGFINDISTDKGDIIKVKGFCKVYVINIVGSRIDILDLTLGNEIDSQG